MDYTSLVKGVNFSHMFVKICCSDCLRETCKSLKHASVSRWTAWT